MSEVLIPPWIIPEQESQEWLDEGSAVFRSAFAPGLSQSQSYGGLRLKLSRRHTVRGEEKAQLLSFLKATRGAYNRVRTRVHFAQRGSTGSSELITNGTFANGTTGFDAGAEYTLAVTDRLMRSTRNSMAGVAYVLRPSSAVSVTQYAPYLSRFFTIQGRGAYTGFKIDELIDSASGTSMSGYGLKSQMLVTRSTTHRPALADVETTGLLAGDYVVVPYFSIARCALVDGGSNALLQSDELDSTWLTTRATVDDQAVIAPDGSGNADIIREDATAANSHYIYQDVVISSTAGEFSYSCSLKAGTRTWASLQMTENVSSHEAKAFINLSTGAVGTVTTTGANWTNVRAVSVSEGNGWYRLHLTARKAAATTITCAIIIAEADNDIVFSGASANSIYGWRASLARSSVPCRATQTTSATNSGDSPTGNVMYLKGLTASTSGILLPGDWFEINGELKQCTLALNSDAAGLGYLQFEPPLVRSPAENDPVVLTDPMGKFLISNIKIDNEFGTQARVTYDLEHIYE